MMKETNVNSLNTCGQHPFTVPEGYFDKLPSRIMQQTTYAVPGAAMASVSWIRHFKTAMAGAAMVLVFILAFFATHLVKAPAFEPALAQLSKQEIQQYLLTNAGVETADIAEIAATKAPQMLEFIDVSPEDVPVEVAMELLQEEPVPQSY